ncbi:MAG: hypothetical protein Q7S89_00300, partial [bacterium]|nr:hypothetical protein [bacterium]
MKALVVGSEIALKGNNRSFFERKLVEGIRGAVHGARVTKLSSAFLLQSDRAVEDVVTRLKRVFGSAYFLLVEEVRMRSNDSEGAIAVIGAAAATLVAAANP